MAFADIEEVHAQETRATQRIEALLRALTNEISFGNPIDVDSTGAFSDQRAANIKGSWVTASLTAATGTGTFIHNLDLPFTSVTGTADTANLPNVRWLVFGLEYGDRTGNNAAPASPAALGFSLFKMTNGAVTRNDIELEFRVTGVVPSATEPLTVSIFFIPAVV